MTTMVKAVKWRYLVVRENETWEGGRGNIISRWVLVEEEKGGDRGRRVKEGKSKQLFNNTVKGPTSQKVPLTYCQPDL